MKTFLVDTSVFLTSPHALYAFDDNKIIISIRTIREMDELARSNGVFRSCAIEFNNILNRICDSPGCEFTLENHGVLAIHTDLDMDIFDLAKKYRAIIVSRNPAVRIEALARGLPAEPFKAEQLPSDVSDYAGRCNLYVSEDDLNSFAKNKYLNLDHEPYCATDLNGLLLSKDYHLTVNEYVTLINCSNPSASTMLGRFDGQKVVPLYYCQKENPVFGVTPRNAGQMFALDALMNPDAPMVILKGPAGTAKTFLSMAAGLQQTLEEHRYRRILATRPNTKMDNDVGFLKGDEKEKVLPTLRGLLDNVDNLMPDAASKKDGISVSPLDTLMENGIIEAQAMAYMRGRSITRQYMVVDEMQNSTPVQALSIITRIGEDSKIVLLGDPDQIDAPYLDRTNNGLIYASKGMRGSQYCWQVTFSERESTRSPLAKEALLKLKPKGLF